MSARNNNSMLQNESSLDDFFGAARDGAKYLEGEPVRQSILNDVMNRAVHSSTPVRRYSTPFKLGVAIMTTLTLSALGILVLGVFAPASKQERVHTPYQASAPQSFPFHSSGPSSNAVVTPPLSTKISVPVRSANHDTAWLPPVRMEAVKPILLSSGQAAQLGIICEGNGNIFYHSTDAAGRILCTQTYQPNGRTLISTVSDSTATGIAISARMITSTKGEKRFFQFEDDHFPLTNTLRSLGYNDSSLHGSYQTSVAVSKSDDTSSTRNAGSHSKAVEFSIQDSTVANEFLKGMGIDPEKSKNVNLDFHILASDSSIGDSVTATKLLSNLGLSATEIKDLMAGKADNAAISKRVSEKMAQQLLSKKPSAFKDLLQGAMTDVAQHQPDVNTLVPLLVENHDAPGTSNALVFWFEPSKTLEAVLGEQYSTHFGNPVAQVTPQGVLQSFLISPNPAAGSTTLHYTLGDARSLRVTVYDITGHKLFEAPQSTVQPAGNGELNLDLSTLPAGVYVVALMTDKREGITQRIVVEN